MFSIDDIQFFIQTHNRAHLLPESINALLSQSAGIKEVTVFMRILIIKSILCLA